MISLSPYLVFNGNCEEAFNYYKKVLGGKDLYIGRYKDVPQEAKKYFPNAEDENVMHATLMIDEKTVIMGNDAAEASGQVAVSLARDFYLYINTDNPAEAIRIFNELSTGGKIVVPIAQTYWAPCYGVLSDNLAFIGRSRRTDERKSPKCLPTAFIL